MEGPRSPEIDLFLLYNQNFQIKTNIMQTQNYKNHSRLVPLFHYVLALLIIGCLFVSARMVFKNWNTEWRNLSILLAGISISLLLLWIFARVFPLKAQDRAIRAEENLRHFALTGKLLDKRLTVPQIVALRFASDTEFLILSEKAANENMTATAIKKSIVNWKADEHRA